MKKIFFVFPLTVALYACGSRAADETTTRQDVIPVKVMPLRQQNSALTITASGQFTTDDEVYLSFKTGGVISSITVKEGDPVHRGQVLATLHLTEIDAQVNQAQLAYEKAVRDHQRTTNLYKDSVATLEQWQNSATSLEMARQQVSTAQFNRSYSVVRATQDGYVLRKMASAGQLISAGSPVLEINGARNSSWLLRVGVSDQQWASIKTGDKAAITIPSLSGTTLPGVVSRKAEGIDPQSGTFIIDVKVTASGTNAIAAGMFGKCSIHSGTTGTAWAIPYDALLDGNGTSGFVFVTNDNKTARKVPVTITGIQKDQVLINGGMENAQSLIISGSAYLNDQTPIRIIP